MKQKVITLFAMICMIFTFSAASAQYNPAFNDYVRTKPFSSYTYFMMQYGDVISFSNPYPYDAYYHAGGVRFQFKGSWLDFSNPSFPLGLRYANLEAKVGSTYYHISWPMYHDAWGNGTVYVNLLEPAP